MEARRQGLVTAGDALLLILAMVTGSGLLLLLALLIGAAVLLVRLWGRYALERVEYRRSFGQDRCFPGETVELTVTVSNMKALPVTFLTVDETVPAELEVGATRLKYLRLGKQTLRLLYGLGWYQTVIRHYRVTPGRRGLYHLGPATVRAGDPFGYVEHSKEVDEPEALLVYPRVMPLEQVGLPTRRPFGDLKSYDRLFADPLRFGGVREYQPGDPPSLVHWKATASAGRLQVKLLEPSAAPGLALFLNTRGGEAVWMGTESEALETGCVLAASVADWAVREGVSFGLYANGLVRGWGLSLNLPPARGPEVLGNALEGLARLEPVSQLTMEQQMAEAVPALSYGTSVAVITPYVGEALAGAILDAHRSGRPVTVIYTGREESDLPRMPGVRVHRIPGEEALHGGVLA